MTGDDIDLDEWAQERDYLVKEDDCDSHLHGSPIGVSVGTSIYSSQSAQVGLNGSSSVMTGNSSSVTTAAHSIAAFDLVELGILQVGSFDSTGAMSNWVISTNPLPVQYSLWMQSAAVISLEHAPGYGVIIRGIYSKHFTNERRAAMGLPAV